MKKFTLPVILGIIIIVAGLSRCKPEPDPEPPVFRATPYNWVTPQGFPQPTFPADNPMTVEGVDLGHHLFFDKRLSLDNTVSCASCHNQAFFFSDPNPLSKGVGGLEGRRSAMVLFNLAWQEFFFWDGRTKTLEEQSLHPIIDPVEMANTLPEVVKRLKADTAYPAMFKAAFGDTEINPDRIAKALAQFERTIVSANSKFDKVVRLKMEQFTAEEQRGFDMFSSDFAANGARGGDCFHCHGAVETGFLLGAFGVDNQFKNNGLKPDFTTDKGRMEVTNLPQDEGKFKIPSVRNMEWSFPYMHDGSIGAGTGVDQVMELIEFYNSGIHENSPNIDPNMTKNGGADKKWTQSQKDDLKAFLLTLTDYELQNDPAFENPFSQ
jgi:cytochrome c peroxidase